MSALWYEYLEESGGEVIPLKYFTHVVRSLEIVDDFEENFKDIASEVRYARNYSGKQWWPIKVVDSLSEGWLRVEFVGVRESSEMVWWNIHCSDSSIRSIEWCVSNNVDWCSPVAALDVDLNDIIKKTGMERFDSLNRRGICNYEKIKVGGYMECWLEHNVGLVWPVRVLANMGGRVRLAWFGSGTSSSFVLFYLDPRLRGLGWARDHGWRFSAPDNAGITIAISNVDTFVRGSPGALGRELCNEYDPEEHSLEEGWQMEAVDARQPSVVRPAFVQRVFDRRYFLVELDGGGEQSRFVGYAGLTSLMPANFSGVSGFVVRGLCGRGWQSHLLEVHTDRYAPHSGYFPGMATDIDADSVFLPGCKLEAVNPCQREEVHAATVTRAMDGHSLVWVRLDTDHDSPDFLVDPRDSVDLFPVGWCEMVGHPLSLPAMDGPQPSLDFPDDITVYLHPQCFLGPFLSRSVAINILPRFIGPGHCLPVFKELFHLLLKVSHKPHKLKRLLQLDNGEDHRDLMATIAIASPKSEHNNRIRRPDWLVEVAIRKRAIPEFCRQTALSLGACPWFITTEARHRCSLDCDARLAAKCGEKMSLQRRRRLFARPLTAIGVSYHSLKTRINGGHSNSSGGESDNAGGGGVPVRGGGDSSDGGIGEPTASGLDDRVQTRGARLPVSGESRRRCARAPRKPAVTVPLAPKVGQDEIAAATSPSENLAEFVIDPAFLAGDIERVTLTSNPLHWSTDQLADYLAGTDCRQLVSWLADQRVDGAAFLLLTLPMLSTLCGLKLEPAIRLCKHVVSLKRAFVEQFADYRSLLPPDSS